MDPDSLLNETTKTILKSRGFEHIKTEGGGIHHSNVWKNAFARLILSFDRGYFDCYLTSVKNYNLSFPLILLLRFIYRDNTFYERELKEANQWSTLTPEGYFQLLDDHFEVLQPFLVEANQEIHQAFIRFFKPDETKSRG